MLTYDKLLQFADKKAALKHYKFDLKADTGFFLGHSRGITDTINIYRTLFRNTDFMLGLWLELFCKRLKANIFSLLKKIPGLRKFYRHIKYGDPL